MLFKIDLEELAFRESESVEWKENGDYPEITKSIVKTLSAFANDIANKGGGYVVCGAKEIRTAAGFAAVEYVGLTASKFQEIQGKVLDWCQKVVTPPIVPVTQQLDVPGDETRKILVFSMEATKDAHAYQDGADSAFYIRLGSQTRQAINGNLRNLLVRKNRLEPFDKRPCITARVTDISDYKLDSILQNAKILTPLKKPTDYISTTNKLAEFVPPLCVETREYGVKPRNFALLLFADREKYTDHFINAYTVVSVYHGTNRAAANSEKHMITGSVVDQVYQVLSIINSHNRFMVDKLSDKQNREKYPQRALQEAVVNAIVHRDYEIEEPNRITLFDDRIEIRSMGNLHSLIYKPDFLAGMESARWRNQSLSYLFIKLQLAQAEGQGITTIYHTMKAAGNPEPEFKFGEDTVTCILPAHPRHRIVREIAELKDLILYEKYDKAENKALEILTLDPKNATTTELLSGIRRKRNK